jgi:hypothetical protein
MQPLSQAKLNKDAWYNWDDACTGRKHHPQIFTLACSSQPQINHLGATIFEGNSNVYSYKKKKRDFCRKQIPNHLNQAR